MKTTIWAHRGSSFMAPENTIEAFQLAVLQKADGIELDIHLTADDQVAVIHDETVDRTTNGTGIVEGLTMAELKKLDASMGRSQYAGAKIPTLPEVFDFMKNNNLRLNIELKEEHECNPKFIQLVAQLEKEYDFSERVMYCSFNHYTLMQLKRLLPHTQVGLLYHAGLINPWEYAQKIGADCIHPSWKFGIMKNGIEEAHKVGLKVNVWTVDEEEEMIKVYNSKADGIISNKPDLALEVRKRIQNI